ncbi:MAG TPA: hypothetical protein VFB04_00170 [Terriglobales bacterium]|nr:hypothetical protein [Terriglobales bacterium]
MLLHQFIVVLTASARRFDSVLLNAVAAVRRIASRARIAASDLQNTYD